MSASSPAALLRTATGSQRVTSIELFFDLVYVLAVTQLSHRLLARPTVDGAAGTALLFAMVWLAWVYTTWVTNWLDPERIAVRLLLLALAFASLAMSSAIPEAFGTRGLAVGVTYAVMQIGRSAFAVVALHGDRLRRNFERILAWCVVSGACAVAGGIEHGSVRELLWLAAVAVDLAGGAVGFYTPGLGRSSTSDWTIEGAHFAERCQAFLLIALGESIVVIGETTTSLSQVDGAAIAAFVAAFVGCAALWWLYFDRSAEEGAQVIATSSDPGRLGRSAYHFIHAVMIAGVIVTAAGDENVIRRPSLAVAAPTAWMVLGGMAVYVAGHAGFKATLWKVVPWTRIVAVVVLALLGLTTHHVPALVLSALAAVVVLAVAASDSRATAAE